MKLTDACLQLSVQKPLKALGQNARYRIPYGLYQKEIETMNDQENNGSSVAEQATVLAGEVKKRKQKN
jgi:hypothetical protein